MTRRTLILDARPFPCPRVPVGRRTRRLPKRVLAYRAWLEAARWELKSLWRDPPATCWIELHVGIPKSRGDLVNHYKAVEDALCGVVIEDDRLVVRQSSAWLPKGEKIRVELGIPA